MGAFDPCSRESSAIVTQPLLTVLMLSSGLVGLETHFMDFVPHPGLLWHSTNPVHSGLRAEEESLSCPRSPKLTAAREPPSTMCLHVASQCPSFLALCSLGSCFCKTMKTLFVSCSPSTLLFHGPLTWLTSAPWHCTFLGEAMEETGVTSSLWAVAADLLGPPLLIQNLLIPVGRLKCLMVLGFLWRKKRKQIAADSPQHILPESHWDRRTQHSSLAKGPALGWRDPERRNPTGWPSLTSHN